MNDNDSRGISYTAGFFMLIAFAVAGLVLASLIGAQVWQQMTGKGLDAMEKGMSDPANSDVMKIIQVDYRHHWVFCSNDSYRSPT